MKSYGSKIKDQKSEIIRDATNPKPWDLRFELGFGLGFGWLALDLVWI